MPGTYGRLSGVDCFAHVPDTSIFHCEAALLKAFWLKGALKCHPGHGLGSFVGRVTPQAPQLQTCILRNRVHDEGRFLIFDV